MTAPPGDSGHGNAPSGAARRHGWILRLRGPAETPTPQPDDGMRAFVDAMAASVARPAPIETFYWQPLEPDGMAIERAIIRARFSDEPPEEAFLDAVLGIMNRGRMESSLLERPAGVFEYDGRLFPRLKSFSGYPNLPCYAMMALRVPARRECCLFFGAVIAKARNAGAAESVLHGLVELSTLFLLGLDPDEARRLTIKENVFHIDSPAARQAHADDLSGAPLAAARGLIASVGHHVDSVVERFMKSAREQQAAGSSRILHPLDYATKCWVGAFLSAHHSRRQLLRGASLKVPAGAVKPVSLALARLLRANERLVGRTDGLYVQVSIEKQEHLAS